MLVTLKWSKGRKTQLCKFQTLSLQGLGLPRDYSVIKTVGHFMGPLPCDEPNVMTCCFEL